MYNKKTKVSETWKGKATINYSIIVRKKRMFIYSFNVTIKTRYK